MFKRLLCAVAVLAATTAMSSAPADARPAQAGRASTSSSSAVLPYAGHYRGHDSHGRAISFYFHGNQMTHFMVNHTAFGGAHVGHAAWHNTCHDGRCTQGMWVGDTQVHGSWSHGGHHVQFRAHLYSHH